MHAASGLGLPKDTRTSNPRPHAWQSSSPSPFPSFLPLVFISLHQFGASAFAQKATVSCQFDRLLEHHHSPTSHRDLTVRRRSACVSFSVSVRFLIAQRHQVHASPT